MTYVSCNHSDLDATWHKGYLKHLVFFLITILGDVVELTAFLAIWSYHGVKPFHTYHEVPPDTIIKANRALIEYHKA